MRVEGIVLRKLPVPAVVALPLGVVCVKLRVVLTDGRSKITS